MEHKLPFEIVKRKILTKKDTITDPEKGCYPEKRSVEELIMYGIININKPRGPR